jgi:hypothetical protein
VGAGANMENKWFSCKTVVYNNPNNTVTVEAYIDDTIQEMPEPHLPSAFQTVKNLNSYYGRILQSDDLQCL